MIWVLIVWLGAANQPLSIATQEFNSHDNCVKAEKVIRAEFGEDAGFVCVEKGKEKQWTSKH